MLHPVAIQAWGSVWQGISDDIAHPFWIFHRFLFYRACIGCANLTIWFLRKGSEISGIAEKRSGCFYKIIVKVRIKLCGCLVRKYCYNLCF